MTEREDMKQDTSQDWTYHGNDVDITYHYYEPIRPYVTGTYWGDVLLIFGMIYAPFILAAIIANVLGEP